MSNALDGIHVLVAEDEPMSAFVMRMMLEEVGAQVSIARNGIAAYGLMIDPHTTIDVVLMDLQMPELNGLQAARMVRQHSDPRVSQMPILALSGNILRGEPQQAIEAGMNGFIAKPASLELLVEEILGALGRSPAPASEH